MADLTLNINGNASGASTALREAGGAVSDLGDDVGKSVVKWQELANITKQAISAVVKFGVDAVKAYAEAERVQKQLARVAGQYTEALSAQAEALSRLYAVDDDIIKQSQTLMVQWGGVGAATEATTKAILDYAAATGQDATAATQDLIRNVESGGVGLAKMGVHFKATGDKGKDLAAAVEALNKKFGGAAASDAATMHGSLGLVSLAFEDLVKDIGEAITAMTTQSGVVGSLTEAIRGLRTAAFGDKEEEKRQERLKVEEQLAGRLEYRKELEGQIQAARKMGSAEDIAALENFYRRNEAGIEQLKRWRQEMNAATAGGASPAVTGRTNAGGKADEQAAKEAARAQAQLQEDIAEADAKRNEAWRQKEADAEEQSIKESMDAEKERLEERRDLQKEDAEQLRLMREQESDNRQKEWEGQLKQEAAQYAQEEKEFKEHLQRMAEQEQMARQAGDQVGAAFVNALADQLAKLAEGEEFDAAMFVGEILASTIAIAGTVIGSAYGQPALGAAIGNLAAMGVRYGASAISARRRPKKKYHSGGWVGDEAELPRYHSGAWIGGDEQQAILQTGERVLSRSEVGRMGGPAGVDAAARGGRPAVVVNLTAIDSKSAADSFVSDLGNGLRDALRLGRGPLSPLLLGANPR